MIGMKNKRLISTVQLFAILFLLISLIAVRLSDKGDIVDRNAGWIAVAFFAATGVFIGSHYIPDGSIPKKKTPDQLLNQIKKSNLRKIK